MDAGTMSPFEHGEVFVLDDGGEVRPRCPLPRSSQNTPNSAHNALRPCRQADLDLGNYERFVDVTLTRDHNITTGKIYQARAPAAVCAQRQAPGALPTSLSVRFSSTRL